MTRRSWWKIGLLGAVIAAVAAALVLRSRHPAFDGAFNQLEIDLRHPDLVVRSKRLADLPRDVAQAPLLKGIVTEEVVQYYQDHPTRLSLLGTLKRLAYDHSLTWPDRLIALALDAPGEVAMWRDGKGAPDYFVMALDQNLAAQAMLELAKVGLPDKQVSVAGKLAGGATVYALTLSPRLTWLLVSKGSRLVVVSHPGLLLDTAGALSANAADLVSRALEARLDGAGSSVSPFAADLGLPPFGGADGARHSIAASAGYLSFGYQHFFPGVSVLRLDRSDAADGAGAWSLSLRATGATLASWRQGSTPLWAALPRGQALCSTVPVEPQRGQPLVEALVNTSAADLLKDLEPVGAVCWGGKGGLFAPTLAMRLRAGSGPRHDATLQTLLQTALRKKGAEDSDVIDEQTAVTGVEGGKAWTRTIEHEFGANRHEGKPVNAVGLIRLGDTLLASSDNRSLEPAIAVAAKTYPSFGESLAPPGAGAASGASPIFTVDGPQLRRLLETETFRTLRADTTPTFYRVARQLLTPRLAAVAGLGQIVVSLPAGDAGSATASTSQWVTLDVRQSPAAL